MPTDALFEPFQAGGLALTNRIVMAPMTRSLSPLGVPGEDVAAYYARRAANGVGLIITEGTWIDHPMAGNDESSPRFHGEDALAAWGRIVSAVHAAGAKIMPQLWHIGQTTKPPIDTIFKPMETLFHPDVVGPSGWIGGLRNPLQLLGRPMSQADIDGVVASYARGARNAMELGFDGVELHGAHGYLIDQFLWPETNKRDDAYGGDPAGRARFGAEVVAAVRHATSDSFPIVFRFSQWKSQDYGARIAETPDELGALLQPLADAGVDIFHASQRRFWEPAFADSTLNLAGWARKLTGKPSILVGSIGLEGDVISSLADGEASAATLSRIEVLNEMVRRNEVDLVAVGRALIADAEWAAKLQAGRTDMEHFSVEQLATLS